MVTGDIDIADSLHYPGDQRAVNHGSVDRGGPSLLKAFSVSTFRMVISSEAKDSMMSLPLAFVHLLPYSISQELKLPVITIKVFVGVVFPFDFRSQLDLASAGDIICKGKPLCV